MIAVWACPRLIPSLRRATLGSRRGPAFRCTPRTDYRAGVPLQSSREIPSVMNRSHHRTQRQTHRHHVIGKCRSTDGVCNGKDPLRGIESGYSLFKHYCNERSVQVNEDDPGIKFLSTPFLPDIRVTSIEGQEISGAGTSVTGFDGDGWEIDIMGVPYPFYKEEFPHHTEAYFGP